MFNKVIKKQERRYYQQDVFILIILLVASCIFSFHSNAQCAMCRAALEGEGNAEKAKAVNDGIVYLMVIPYLLVGVIGIIIYRMRKNRKV